MTEKMENYGCLSKSLVKFLYMEEEKRREKFGNDVNKYYERVVKNVNSTISDIMLAYNHLPQEQREKIDLLTHVDTLLDYVEEKEIKLKPKKIISNVKSGLKAILRGHVRDTNITKLAEPDFEKVYSWLDYLTPKHSSM